MRHFDHELNHGEQELLHQHLNGCPDCRNLYDGLHQILTPLEAAPPVEPDPGLEKMVMERIKKLPVTRSKPRSHEETGLAKMIYGWLATALVLLMLAIHLALQNTNFPEFLLQIRQYSGFLSGIALDSQIILQVIAGVFSQTISLIFREIQNIFLAAIMFGVVLTIRYTVVKLAGPKLDLQ
jgi:hypothetical protein